MPTADDLYLDILKFLARGANPNSPEGPHDLASGANTPPVPICGEPIRLSQSHAALLPTCTLGKGELSAHFELHASLRTKGHRVISEVPPDPLTATSNRDRLDLVALDAGGSPIAVVELKHHSVHQSASTTLLKALDTDFSKRHIQSIAGHTIAPPKVPLIQIGLLTAICSPDWRTHSPISCSPNFLRTYVDPIKHSDAMNTMPPAPSTTRFKNYYADIEKWRHAHPSWPYAQGVFGWGPCEQYGHTPSGLTVSGFVGYVCVMTK